jgi:hypothetical protein
MKLKPNPDRIYAPDQIKDFVKRTIDRVGLLGWSYLSQEMRGALIAQQALRVIAGNGRDSIPCAAIHCLHLDMLIIAGLIDD